MRESGKSSVARQHLFFYMHMNICTTLKDVCMMSIGTPQFIALSVYLNECVFCWSIAKLLRWLNHTKPVFNDGHHSERALNDNNNNINHRIIKMSNKYLMLIFALKIYWKKKNIIKNTLFKNMGQTLVEC